MPQCDPSQTYMRAVWPKPSPADLLSGSTAGVSEVSRFSCMKFLGVLWGLRLRRAKQELALSPLSMLPSAHYKDVGARIASFRSSIPTPPIPLFTLRRAPRDAQRKTRGRVDRYSFLVRLLPPLLHAGLARRTVIRIYRQLTFLSPETVRCVSNITLLLLRRRFSERPAILPELDAERA